MEHWSVLFFGLLLASAAANIVPSDKTAVYSYNTVVLSGSPEITQQFAAVGIRCEVKVTKSAENQVVIKISDVTVGRANEIFHQISPDEIPLKFSHSDIYTSNLSRSFVVQFQTDGSVEKLQFDARETEWSKNFKSGLATMFQIRKIPLRKIVAENSQVDELGTVFQASEPTFSGVCTAIYDYQTMRAGKMGGHEINFTKAIDYDTCDDGIAPYFGVSTHRAFECKECNHPQHALHRDIIYKYNLWIDESENYIIRRGISDGIVRFSPLGRNADAATILHNRTLTLERWSSDKSLVGDGHEMKWEWPTSNLFEKLQTIRQIKDLTVPIIYYELFEHGVNHIHEARQGIKKIARWMVEEPSEEELELIAAEIPIVQRALFTLTYSQLEELAREFSSKTTERKLLLDLVAVTATNPCIKFLLDASTKRMITIEETVELLPTIASHIANPNVVLMDYVMEFCKSSHVRSNNQLVDTCFLSWGSMVAKTCASGPYQLPKAPRMYCAEQDRQRYVNVIDWMIRQVDDIERKMSLLSALGNMAVKEIIPVIEKYMWRDVGASDVLRVKTIYALIPLTKIDPEWVKERLIPIFFDADEDSKVRIAAFDVLISCSTRDQLYEKIAARIQYEEDVTVNAYVYSTYKSLANITHPCWKEVSSHAAFALKLIDETHDTSAWIATKMYDEGEMEYLDVNSFRRWSSLGEAGSLVPSRFYLQFENFLAGATTNLIKLAFYGNNTSQLVEKLLGPSALFSEQSLLERMTNLNAPMRNKGGAQMAHKLGFESPTESEFWAHIARTFMDFHQRNYFIDKDTIVNAIKTLSKPLSHWKKDFSVQKTFMPAQIYLQLPIDSGFNVELSFHTAMQMALSVDVDIKSTRESSRMVYDGELKLRGHFAAKSVTKLGVWMPAEQSTISVGLESALMSNPVVAGHARLAINNTSLALTVQPSQNVKSGDVHTLVHYHTKPFTAIEKKWKFKPLDEWVEYIHVRTPKKYEFPLIDDSLVLQVKHEDFWDDRATIYNYLTENSAYGIAAFWWLTAQANMREYRVVWKPWPLPEFQYDMDWRYEAAASDPEKRYRNFWYVLWKDVAGWSDAPMDCRYDGRKWSSSLSDENIDSSSDESVARHLKEMISSGEDTLKNYLLMKMKSSSNEKTKKSSSEENSEQSFMQKVVKYAELSGVLRIPKKIHAALLNKESSQESTHSGHENSDVQVEKGTIGEGVATYWIRAEARILGRSGMKGYRSQVVWKKHRQDLRKTVKVVVEPVGNAPQKWVCWESEVIDEKPPCLFGRTTPDMSKASITGKAKLSWGRSCSQTDENIEFWIKAKKSPEQLNPTKDDPKPWFYRQCEKDVVQNRPMSFACIEKTKDQAKLDWFEATIKCTQCAIHNATEHIRDFIVSQLYPHMSRDPLAENTRKQMKVIVRFRPHIPVMDVQVTRPHETLKFGQIFYGNWYPYVKRPSISRTVTHRALNYFSDNTLTPTCTVGNRYVDNFNNNTFRFRERTGCEFLLCGDSSSANLFSVLSRLENGKKVLTVHQLKNKIEIFPNRIQDVVINGRNYSMKDRSILFIKDDKYGPKLLGFIVKTSSLYKVVLTFNRISVLFDGDFTQIITSNLWRHKLHGVCGEYNPQERNRFRGPRKCVYTDANDFAQTYALRKASCPAMPLKNTKTCDVQTDASKGRVMTPQIGAGSCVHKRPLMIKNENEKTVCISTEEVVDCDDDCVATGLTDKSLHMRCVSTERYTNAIDKAILDLYVKVSSQKSPGFVSRPFYQKEEIHRVPKSCIPRN